jgi:hypothetical protein
LAIVATSFVACGDDEQPTGPTAPSDFDIVATTDTDVVTVSWDAQSGVDSFKVELSWNPTLTQWVLGDATEVDFTSDDGLEDGVDATAAATAYNAGGSTGSSNTPMVTTDFFPWDEYYPTSLHGTRVGKGTFYNTSPNMGAGLCQMSQPPGYRDLPGVHGRAPRCGHDVHGLPQHGRRAR